MAVGDEADGHQQFIAGKGLADTSGGEFLTCSLVPRFLRSPEKFAAQASAGFGMWNRIVSERDDEVLKKAESLLGWVQRSIKALGAAEPLR